MTLDELEALVAQINPSVYGTVDCVSRTEHVFHGPLRRTENEACLDAYFYLAAYKMLPKMIKVLKAAKCLYGDGRDPYEPGCKCGVCLFRDDLAALEQP